MEFFQHWRKIYPEAQALSFPGTAHYLLEDNPEEIIPAITAFIGN
jgi:pimeloyl-ACP methyl ester carboxylesterase